MQRNRKTHSITLSLIHSHIHTHTLLMNLHSEGVSERSEIRDDGESGPG